MSKTDNVAKLDNVAQTDNLRHRCKLIRESGERCRGFATSSGYCPGHSGVGLIRDPRKAQAKGAKLKREASQARKLTASEVYRRAVEEHAAAFVKRRLNIVRHGTDSDALRAMEQLESRALGKPTEVVEARDSGEVGSLSLSELQERRALLERDAGLAALLGLDTETAD